MTFRTKIAAALVCTGLLTIAGSASAASGIVYSGNIASSTAAKHLFGAHPTDTAIVSRFMTRTTTGVTVHVKVNRINADYKASGWSRLQEAQMLLYSPTGKKASMIATLGSASYPAPKYYSPCSGTITSGGRGASATTGYYVMSLTNAQMAACGFRHGQTIEVDVLTDIEAYYGTGSRSGIWTAPAGATKVGTFRF